jgi:hypothetical protein
MEARHDLRKFITELPGVERGPVLSSGRGLLYRPPGPEVRAAWRDDDGEVGTDRV